MVQAELAQLGTGRRVVIAHSLAVPLWLRVAQHLPAAERVDDVLLVAPPSPAVLAGISEVAAFSSVAQDHEAVMAAATRTRLVCSDNDPYCPEGARKAYVGLGLDGEVIPGAGHLDPEAGYGPWSTVRSWCLDPCVRFAGQRVATVRGGHP